MSSSCSHSLPAIPTSNSTRENNICHLLARREICPRNRSTPKTLWQEDKSKWTYFKVILEWETTDARQFLTSWVEAKSLRHLSASYCPLLPPPRSTIAAAFSFDGKTLASTHGDHTVKIIDYQTGKCLKVLSGHRRTPWVVRFHPLYPEILASGSLDHEVRLWDANTADCIASKDFHRPIASIAFHAQGEILAVASGHKLYIWNYKGGESFNPAVVLRTRRSLRAVHFHPHAAPFLLTAEVNDIDSPDSPLIPATTTGYLNYPAPALLFSNIHSTSHPSTISNTSLVPPTSLWPASSREHGRVLQREKKIANLGGQTNEISLAAQRQMQSNLSNQQVRVPGESLNLNIRSEEVRHSLSAANIEPHNTIYLKNDEESHEEQLARSGLQNSGTSDAGISSLPSFDFSGIGLQLPVARSNVDLKETSESFQHNQPAATNIQTLLGEVDAGRLHQLMSSGDAARWELPFLQGWLMGQTQAGLQTLVPSGNFLTEGLSRVHGTMADAVLSDVMSNADVGASVVPFNTTTDTGYHRVTSQGFAIPLQISSYMGYSRDINTGAAEDSLEIPPYTGHSRLAARSWVRTRSRLIATGNSMEGIPHLNVQSSAIDSHPATISIGPEIAPSMSSDSSTDLPCTVKLKIWTYDAQNPSAPLDADKCRFTIPYAVLCSEMGAHFSPCGRFLAACVACVLPNLEVEPGLRAQSYSDASEVSTSPTRHPISGHRIIYELRIYSLEETTFGLVLASRAIRAAHCLTSIQFSPTSEHILLAYGRRHGSLLRSYFTDGDARMHIYTILEVYRVSDMELVRVLPSSDDEVNVACFHPLPGCGLVYGTKEGKLRILRHDASIEKNITGANS